MKSYFAKKNLQISIVIFAILILLGIVIFFPIQKAIGNNKVNRYLESKGVPTQGHQIEEIYMSKLGGYNYFVTYNDEPYVRYIYHYKYGKEVSIDDAEYRNDENKEFYNLAEMSSKEQTKTFKHLTDEEIAAWFSD